MTDRIEEALKRSANEDIERLQAIEAEVRSGGTKWAAQEIHHLRIRVAYLEGRLGEKR